VAEREKFTGVIVPRFWDELRHLSLAARALAAYLVTGRHNDDVAGLARLSMVTVADDLGITMAELEDLWLELDAKAPGFVEVDHAARVVRIPNQPKVAHAPNHKVIRAWWRGWRAVPDCDLKVAHVLSLKACLREDCGDLTREAWAQTFGIVDTSTVRERLPNPSPTVSPTVSQRSVSSVECRVYPETPSRAIPGPVLVAGQAPLLVLPESKPRFDLEEIYRPYPRKSEGKSKGLERLAKDIRTTADFEACVAAAKNYAASRAGEDPTYTKHFKTWVGEWRDWIDWSPAAPRIAADERVAGMDLDGLEKLDRLADRLGLPKGQP